MGDNLVIRFQYQGKDADVIVSDVDKLSLLDLIVDYWEICEKEHTPTPKFPTFSYLYKMNHVTLVNDNQLMKMLTDIQRRDLIYIWVRESEKPTTVVEAAMKLRTMLKQTNKPSPTPDQHKETHISQSMLTQSQIPNPTAKIPNPTTEIPDSPLHVYNVMMDNFEFWENLEVSEIEPNNGRGRGRGRMRGSGRGRGSGRENLQIPDNVPMINLGSSNLPTGSPLFKRRIPKSTARRHAQLMARAVAIDLRPNFNNTLELDLDGGDVVGGNVNEDFNTTTTHVQSGVEDDDSQDSEFHGNDDDSSVSYSDVDDDAGNLTEMGIDGMIVNDNFDPYQGPQLDDECDDMDNYLAKLYKNGEVYKEEEWGKIPIKPWQIFIDKQHLRDIVKDYCIQSGFAVIVEKANNKIYTILCSDERCSWRLHASVLADGVSWAIKSITGEHACLELQTRNKMVTAEWAQKVLLEDIRANNDIPLKALNKLLFERYGVTLPKSTMGRMKNDALVEIHGGFDVSYSYLPKYCEVVRQTNPTSSAHCMWNSPQHPERPLGFTSIFISFRACLDGLFAGCRGVIGVDGTFLKGNYGGVLLSAVTLDGNNEMFSVAWGIVSAEDDECWKFFIHHLKSILVSSDRGDNWCIISDRHKSIDKACIELWPTVDRRYCCKHLSVNFKRVFPGPKMWQLFWLAANATSNFIFGKAMKQLNKVKAGARVWLSNLGEQSRWSKHQFNPAFKCDVNNTNFVESFNASLGANRGRPVFTLLEEIRRVSMVRMATRRESCEKWERQDICPNIVKRVKFLCKESRMCLAYKSSYGEYEIVDGKSTLPVSLNNHTCKCNAWQLTGVPCKHGMRAILDANLDPHKFVQEWHSVSRYKMAYNQGIKAIPDMEQWPETQAPEIGPPAFRRGVGRPTKNRKRGEEEQRKGKRRKTVKCGICGEFGHNKLTCQKAPTKKQKKEKQKNVEHAATTSKKGKEKVQ